ETVTAEGRLELRRRRHHEAQPRGRIRELALQVEEVGAGNVRLLVSPASGHGDVRVVAPRRRSLEIGRAIVDAHARLTEELRELLGAHEGLGIAHGFSLVKGATSRSRRRAPGSTRAPSARLGS